MIGSGRSIRGAPRGGSTPSPQNNAPRGTPAAAAQNALRGLLRVVTPVVNLVNHVVQGVTGGRGGIAQLARGITIAVNRAYQQSIAVTWGVPGGSGGQAASDDAAAGMSAGTGADDAPPLPPPPQDIGESNDRLRQLNEEEESVTPPVRFEEFYGDDYELERLGESIQEAATRFLHFVRAGEPEVGDGNGSILQQIRRLFEIAGQTAYNFGVGLERSAFGVTYDPNDTDYKATFETNEMLEQLYSGFGFALDPNDTALDSSPDGFPAFSNPPPNLSSEDLSQRLVDDLIGRADRYGFALDLQDLQDPNAKEVIMRFIETAEEFEAANRYTTALRDLPMGLDGMVWIGSLAHSERFWVHTRVVTTLTSSSGHRYTHLKV